MKNLLLLALAFMLFSCSNCKKECPSTDTKPFIGSWQLLSSEYIKKDTTISNVVPGQTMIKMITPTHFAFFSHDTLKGAVDSLASYMSGGGTYTFKNNKYVEHLEYCTAREWEKHAFEFELEVKGDTLVQTGIEELEELGLGKENLLLVEKYIRIK